MLNVGKGDVRIDRREGPVIASGLPETSADSCNATTSRLVKGWHVRMCYEHDDDPVKDIRQYKAHWNVCRCCHDGLSVIGSCGAGGFGAALYIQRER